MQGLHFYDGIHIVKTILKDSYCGVAKDLHGTINHL